MIKFIHPDFVTFLFLRLFPEIPPSFFTYHICPKPSTERTKTSEPQMILGPKMPLPQLAFCASLSTAAMGWRRAPSVLTDILLSGPVYGPEVVCLPTFLTRGPYGAGPKPMSRLFQKGHAGARCGNPPFVSDRRMVEGGFASLAGHTALLRSVELTQLNFSLGLREPRGLVFLDHAIRAGKERRRLRFRAVGLD